MFHAKQDGRAATTNNARESAMADDVDADDDVEVD